MMYKRIVNGLKAKLGGKVKLHNINFSLKLNNTRVTDFVISELIRDPLGLFGLASPLRYSLGNQHGPAVWLAGVIA